MTAWSHAADMADEVDQLRRDLRVALDEAAHQRARAIKAEADLRLLRGAVHRRLDGNSTDDDLRKALMW